MLEDLQEVVPKLLHTHLIIHVSYSNFRNNYRKELVESVMVVCTTCQCSLAKHFFLQLSMVSATQFTWYTAVLQIYCILQAGCMINNNS